MGGGQTKAPARWQAQPGQASGISIPHDVLTGPRGPVDFVTGATALRDMADWLDRYALHLLTDNQADFLAKMLRLLARGGTPTPKQAQYLSGLHAMHGGCDD